MPTYCKEGDAIEGHRIGCQFRKIGEIKIIHGTSSHRARRASLYDAYCVIEIGYTK